MATEGLTQQKYHYRFTLEARPAGTPTKEDASAAELQKYINEILGVKKAKPETTAKA